VLLVVATVLSLVILGKSRWADDCLTEGAKAKVYWTIMAMDKHRTTAIADESK